MKRSLIIVFTTMLVLGGIPAGVSGKPVPSNSVQREYYDNGKLRLEVHYRKGLVQRKRTFYRNGRLQLEYKYKNGVLHLRRSFYENGILQSLWTKNLGATKFYHRNGSLRTIVDLDPGQLDKELKSSYLFQ
jgi:antitoxin component YwqK of YwqJK toxin-antitoxin module